MVYFAYFGIYINIRQESDMREHYKKAKGKKRNKETPKSETTERFNGAYNRFTPPTISKKETTSKLRYKTLHLRWGLGETNRSIPIPIRTNIILSLSLRGQRSLGRTRRRPSIAFIYGTQQPRLFVHLARFQWSRSGLPRRARLRSRRRPSGV